jgi:hypothetical protein
VILPDANLLVYAFADLDRETGDQGSAPSEQVASSIDTLYNRAVRD